ncbi:MAG: UTP--glucose-1-phosphate uridylyltransferase [Bacilli bacterium]|nr:UTP--glucose-1-phosphate uridylyltransferase [Bacilli bacterium]
MKIYEKLKFYNQEHLLNFYKELNFIEKILLKKQINKIDFEKINNLYKNSFYDEELDINKISNLNCIYKLKNNEIKKYNKIGEELIKNKKYGIVIMAGGNASRLDLDIPKGCLKLNINNKKISIFEIYINQLKNIYEKYNVYIPLYIMTSSYNYKNTKKFFKDNNYFKYPKDKIVFFKQNNLPILDINGKILLKNKYNILFGPNGNGDVFNSLKYNNLIKKMKKNNLEYILFSTIDNVLTNLIDFKFIGSTIYNNYNLATKTILKNDENDKNWVFCKYDNKPYMIPSRYLNNDINNKKDNNNNFVYRDKNITYHLININEIIKYSNIKLKYHRAFKKNNYMNNNGEFIIADKQNTFKFEKFIFDAFEYSNDMLLYRIDEKEFCTIKNKEDIKKAENILNKVK